MTPREVRLQAALLGLSLSLGILTPLASAESRATRGATVYQRSRAFRIPFQSNPAERSRRREVQLWVSTDLGWTWKPKDSTSPDRPSFTFEAPKDGEYWLAVRSVDAEGRLHPGSNEQIEPSMKVVVDTAPPVLNLVAEERSASLASVRWEIHDDHPDLESLAFEYQVEGSSEWRPVPKQKTGWNGISTWDAGYSESLKVRATVVDRAGNRTEAILPVPAWRHRGVQFAANDVRGAEERSPLAPAAPQLDRGRLTTSREHEEREDSPARPTQSKPRSEASDPRPDTVRLAGGGATGHPQAEEASDSRREPARPTERIREGSSLSNEPSRTLGPDALASDAKPTRFEERAGTDPSVGPASTAQPSGRRQGAPSTEIPTIHVQRAKFALPYAIEGAGPDGPIVVELWVTRDGGLTWNRQGLDPDRRSPFTIDLGEGGTYGLSLIARDDKGLGDPEPASGDPPQMWVNVAPQSSGRKSSRSNRTPGVLQRVFGR